MQSNITLHISGHNRGSEKGLEGVRLKWLLMTWDWVFWVFVGISSRLTLDDKKENAGFL